MAYLGSGDELVDLDRFDEALAGRKIVSSNNYTIHALIRVAGGEPVNLGIAPDSPDALREKMGRTSGSDAIVTTAGISVGEFDHVREVLTDLGATMTFWKVRMRPGAPVGFGMLGRRPGSVFRAIPCRRWSRSSCSRDRVSSGDLGLVAREIDWVTKYQLIERYRAKHDLPLSSPRVAQLDLAYHDLHRGRGLYYLLQRRGAVERACRDLDIFDAKSIPPQTTRARLRGEFIRRAQERRRDFTVDWVHLKLNDQAQRTVLCKDPFRSVDERVEKLIAGM